MWVCHKVYNWLAEVEEVAPWESGLESHVSFPGFFLDPLLPARFAMSSSPPPGASTFHPALEVRDDALKHLQTVSQDKVCSFIYWYLLLCPSHKKVIKTLCYRNPFVCFNNWETSWNSTHCRTLHTESKNQSDFIITGCAYYGKLNC